MITSSLFSNKTYVVVGLGLSGLSSVQTLQASQAQVWAWDDNPVLREDAKIKGIQICALETIDWSSVTALILSPSIPHQGPLSHISAQKAQASHVPILCDIDLLAQAYPHARFIGITGTNGKSTTTALIGHLMKTANYSYQMGGNIGIPALSLAPLDHTGVYVLELSSYQLERVPHLRLDMAVFLNLKPDHLARHGDMNGYMKAKRKIFEQRSDPFKGIIGIDDADCLKLYKELKETHQMISLSTSPKMSADLWVKEGKLYEDRELVEDVSNYPHLRGIHNAQNIAAAYGVGKLWGINKELLLEGIKTFKGLPHRLESLGFVKEIEFINDSKATNAEATAKALACYEKIYWILGGQAKDNGLEGLESFYSRVRHAFLIGEAAQKFAETLKGKVNFTRCGTLERAIQEAYKKAEQDPHASKILLSPVCASWDQFKNFEHRGEAFRTAFQKIKNMTA